MDHQIQGLTHYGIGDLLAFIGAQELATYPTRDEQDGRTHVLVAVDLGLMDLGVQDNEHLDGQLHRWDLVRADLLWTSTGEPLVAQYRLQLSILHDPIPRPEDGTMGAHAWDDFRRHVMERATGA
jgi:hypothetical protein